MDKVIIFAFVLLYFSFISAICESGQIDINSASLTELDEIVNVGETVAGYIIDARPFNSVDELRDKIDYIGPSRLEDIKTQGLACVEDDPTQQIENEEEEIENEEENEEIVTTSYTQETLVQKSENVTFEAVSLGAKDIKNPKTSEVEEDQRTDKNKLLMYGFVGFSLLIGLMLMLKKRKYTENEFR